jgi:hypothetical protein
MDARFERVHQRDQGRAGLKWAIIKAYGIGQVNSLIGSHSCISDA